MKYVRYGRTASFVSSLAMGAMTFGESNLWKLSGIGKETADKMIKKCVDTGINLFDTADIYDAGESEKLLGAVIKPYREQVMIATKMRGRIGPGINQSGLSRHHMHIALRNSMERLETDWVDIYQYHGWDTFTDFDEILSTMERFVQDGKVLYPAVSNFSAWQMSTLQAMAQQKGYARYESAQMNYSLLNRDIEYEILPFMKYSKMTLLAWSPLHGGLLSGKYRKDEKPKEGYRMTDRGFFFPYFDDGRGWRIIDRVRKIAEDQGCKPSQVSLSWIVSKGYVALIGARTIEQLEENLESVNVNLKRSQIDSLDKLTVGREMYPNWMIDRQGSDKKEFEIID